jgi:hypothetical protein
MDLRSNTSRTVSAEMRGRGWSHVRPIEQTCRLHVCSIPVNPSARIRAAPDENPARYGSAPSPTVRLRHTDPISLSLTGSRCLLRDDHEYIWLALRPSGVANADHNGPPFWP